MTELKTLKDLEHSKVMIEEEIKEGKPIKHELFISQNLLKEEAIKRWHHFNNLSIKALQEKIPQRSIRYAGHASEIMDFFNITEEDLK